MPISSLPLCSVKSNIEPSSPPVLDVSWNDYSKIVEKLAKKIEESGWEFDQIVCIARGGMFVGDPLSRIFNKPLAVIFASSYRSDHGKGQEELHISKNIAMVVNALGPRVLLVDDLADSGVTMRKLKERIESDENVVQVKTAVLWNKTCSTFVPDFYADLVDGRTWINQPFECYDNPKSKEADHWVRKFFSCCPV